MDFLCFLGTAKICVSTSFMSAQCGSPSKPLSNDTMGREPFKWLPLKLSSSIVWMLVARNLMDGPIGEHAM